MNWPIITDFKEFYGKLGVLYKDNCIFILITRRNKQKYITCIDESDEELLAGLSLGILIRSNGSPVVRTSCGFRTENLLHRVILNVSSSEVQVDHIDGNTLNNQRHNLREASASENAQNRHAILSDTGRRGVTYEPFRQKFKAHCTIDYKKVTIGRFDSLDDADKAASEYRAMHMPFSKDARANH